MGSCFSVTTEPATVYRDATYENTPEFTFNGIRAVVKVLRLIDGDTVDIALKQPDRDTCFRHRVRLFGIDTPEKRPPKDSPTRDAEIAASKRSTEALRGKLAAEGFIVMAHFHPADKYGRLLCTFYTMANAENINEWMITNGYAYAYYGKTKKTFEAVEEVDA